MSKTEKEVITPEKQPRDDTAAAAASRTVSCTNKEENIKQQKPSLKKEEATTTNEEVHIRLTPITTTTRSSSATTTEAATPSQPAASMMESPFSEPSPVLKEVKGGKEKGNEKATGAAQEWAKKEEEPSPSPSSTCSPLSFTGDVDNGGLVFVKSLRIGEYYVDFSKLDGMKK